MKIGSDNVTLNGNLSGFAGPISVTQGQLVLASPAAAAAPMTSVYTASSGGTLQFFGASYNLGTANATVLSQSGGVVQFNGTTVNLGISQATITAQSGGLVQFNNTTVNGSDLADTYCQSGALVQYQNANIYGGVLFGGGTYHILSGSAASTFNSIVNYGTLQQNGSANFTNVTNNGLIAGSGGLTLLGGLNATNGTLTLGGTNTMSQWGGNNGALILQSGGLLNNQYGDVEIFGGGQLTISSGGTLNTASDGHGEALDITAGSLVNNGTIIGTTNVNYGGVATGSGAFTFGPINVSSGTLAVNGGTMQSSGVVLDNAAIVGNGVLAAAGTIATTVTIAPACGLTLTLPNSLSGAGQLIENGQGTLLLVASNSYSGGTTINQGKLAVDGWLTNSAVSVSGGTLGGTGSLGTVTVAPNGQLAPGNPLGAMNLSGTLNLESGAVMDYDLDTPSTSSEVLMPTGELILSGQQLSDFKFMPTANLVPGIYPLIEAGSISGVLGSGTSGTIDGYSATLAVEGNNLVLTVVPEPSTFGLLAVAIGMLGLSWRRVCPSLDERAPLRGSHTALRKPGTEAEQA